MKATNIILQGLPADIYSLVNHHIVAKDLWERVQLLIQGTSLTKQERECKLYDAFDKFAHIKGESLHKYYLRFTQLINEMNIYKMKLEQFQVKLNPLALVANHQMTPPHFNTYQSSYKNPQFQQKISPSPSPQYGSIHPIQHYSTTYPSIPHAITYPSASYPNAYSLTIHQAACPQPHSVPQIEYTVSTVNQQTHMAEFPQIDSGTRANTLGTRWNNLGQQSIVKCFNCQGEGHMARQCLKPKRKRDATWFREKVLLVKAQGTGKVLNEEELEFLADPGVAEDVLSEDTNSLAQQDAFILSVFEQLSNQVTNCNKVNNNNLIANESLSVEIERYKERVKFLEERQNVDLGTREKLIPNDIIRDKDVQFVDFEKEIKSLKQTLSEQLKEKESLTKTFNIFKNKSKEKEDRNIDK
ncbi:integrase, catalytic region, zinc finger, CCHC-type containing protein [Tanacetum coccineum]